MLDLTMGGCRIESPVPIILGFSLELRVFVPDHDWPLMIAAASVQWLSGLALGVAFLQLRETEQRRLDM